MFRFSNTKSAKTPKPIFGFETKTFVTIPINFPS